MKLVKILSVVAIAVIVVFGAVNTVSINVFAEEAAPGSDGSNTPEVEAVIPNAPAAEGSNTPEEGSIIPGTDGSNNNETPAIVPNSEGSNGNETPTIIPNTEGSNGDESSGGGSTLVTYPISISQTGSGSVTCLGYTTCPTSVYAGTQIQMSVTPGSGYKIGNSTHNGNVFCSGDLTNTCNYTFDVSSAQTFNIAFESTGGSSQGGGGGSFISSSGGSSINPILALANSATSSCPLLTTFIKAGAVNNSAEVAKLQSFLRTFQGSNIAVNGTYDTATQAAVRSFQSKYLSDVMGPWGASQSSGFVYITTQKKINELACNSPFILSAGDMAVINAYKNRLVENQPAVGGETTPATSTEVGPTLETGNEVGTGAEGEIGSNVGPSQTAAVGNTSILARFWNFIVGLFK